MLQSVLSGKAQEAYSSLTVEDSSSYNKIKAAVLKAYERVPKANRQCFRSWERKKGQTYAECTRDMSTHYRRWLTALQVTTFDELCDLMILEQFKNSLPERIATYITERKMNTAAEAAVSADEYVLLHKGSYRERSMARDVGERGHCFDAVPFDMTRSKRIGHFKPELNASANFENGNTCNYSHKKGHWKADCAVLKAKTRGVKAIVRPVAFAAPVKVCVSELLTPHTCESQVLEAYAPFIRGGSVSLVGSDVEVPIKILRATGVYSSYIVDSVGQEGRPGRSPQFATDRERDTRAPPGRRTADQCGVTEVREWGYLETGDLQKRLWAGFYFFIIIHFVYIIDLICGFLTLLKPDFKRTCVFRSPRLTILGGVVLHCNFKFLFFILALTDTWKIVSVLMVLSICLVNSEPELFCRENVTSLPGMYHL
uniref:SCAN box domain-containing protein n=1 Tax=Dicentrarchus labrax TaxID=13489 RepID=A0A8P4K9M3_DICLA